MLTSDVTEAEIVSITRNFTTWSYNTKNEKRKKYVTAYYTTLFGGTM